MTDTIAGPRCTALMLPRLFRLALEKGEAGARYHAVAEEGVAFRDSAEAIGRQLGLPTAAISPQDVHHFGELAPFVSLDNPTSSAVTQSDWDGRR